MAAFIEELGAWIGTNVAGIDYWNSGTQTGNLFVNELQDVSGTACALIEKDVVGNEGADDARLVMEFRVVGANAETLSQAAFAWVLNRSGTVTTPGPFNLTSWNVELLKPGRPEEHQSRPAWDGRNESGEDIYTFDLFAIYRPL